MGEHKFEVGMRVRRTLVDASTLVPAGTLGSVVQMRGSLPCITWDGFPGVGVPYHDPACVEPAADPPSVGVLGPCPHSGGEGVCVSCSLNSAILAQQREEALVAQQHAYLDQRQRQMAAQQQGQGAGLAAAQAMGGDWVSGKEHAALKGERDGLKVQCDALREACASLTDELRRYKMLNGDAFGDRDVLRLKVADLETQVAYLTRELVLAKGRAKGGR